MNLNCLHACVNCPKYCKNYEQLIKRHRLDAAQLLSLRNQDSSHIYYMLRGHVVVVHNNEQHEIFTEQMFLITKNISSHCVAKEDSVLIELPILSSIDLCSAKVLDLLKSDVKYGVYHFHALCCKPGMMIYFDLLEDILSWSMNCVYLHELKIVEFLLSIKFEYSREEITRFFYPLIKELDGFKVLIRKSVNAATTARDLASISGMPYSNFLHYFKKQFGVSAQEWLHANRVKLIEERLYERGISISDIIREFNFSSAAHFSKFCKENFGHTPTEFISTIVNSQYDEK